MSTFSLKRFSEPSALKAITPTELLRLLEPFASYFESRGARLPTAAATDDLDHAGLAKILMAPGRDTPEDMSNALYFIHEMATPDDMVDLMDECERRGIALGLPDGRTAADVAVRVWLRDRKIVERKHAEKQSVRVRSFEHFRTRSRPGPRLVIPADATIAALEQEMARWFEKKKRGASAQVFSIPRGDGVGFLVRHGLPFERRGVLDSESPGVVFQGDTYDVLEYIESAGELCVHAKLRGEKELYRKKFGLYLFGDESTFLPAKKYTLEPLRTLGRKALECADIDGMVKVWLKRIEFLWNGDQKAIEVQKAADVFAAIESRRRKFPRRPIIHAVFGVQFKDSTTPRTVSVRAPRGTQYMRDGDSDVVEKWLWERGFVIRDK